jgi:hypothetical protein
MGHYLTADERGYLRIFAVVNLSQIPVGWALHTFPDSPALL